jgi:superfamily II DNA or RNA helicase
MQVKCDRGLAQELSEFFTFMVPGYQFTPKYKNKLWDGKIRLLDTRTMRLYRGLIDYVKVFCKQRDYDLEIDPELELSVNYSLKEGADFAASLGLPFVARDYQLQAFVHAVRNRRLLILSPTASGKSLIIYLILRYFQSIGLKRGLLIAPTTSLVEQMYSDFESYGYDSKTNCHRIYGGKDKTTTAFLTISTWQSLYTQNPDFFNDFDFVFGDESHLFKAKSLTTILMNCVNAKYRIGLTGTLDGTQTNRMVLEGLFGSVYKTVTTKELIDSNSLAAFKIKCLTLKYPKEVCSQANKWDYQDEINFIVSNDARNRFIKNLVLSLSGNTLVLFSLVDKHGKVLYNLLQESVKSDRKLFFVYGNTEVEERENARKITENEENAIIVASYATFSTGINIRNLHNVVFASPSKSRIRNLQSIGRVLRLGVNKEQATLFDLSDDLRIGKKPNITLQHFIERLKIYDDEKFEYKLYNIDLKNG